MRLQKIQFIQPVSSLDAKDDTVKRTSFDAADKYSIELDDRSGLVTISREGRLTLSHLYNAAWMIPDTDEPAAAPKAPSRVLEKLGDGSFALRPVTA
jgi:hypothetical protein